MSKKKKQASNQLEVQNASKTLYANIRFLSVDDPIRSLVITSSIPNEGKTTTAINLAQAIATSGKRVLLVEADMRRRSLASMMHAHSNAGLYAVLADQVPVMQAVASTTTPNLSFLDVEPSIPNPADLIASRRFKNLTKVLSEHFDFVIYDTPPVGTFVDAAVLSTLVDATIMVVRPNMVKRADVQHAYEQLRKADANVIGICATFVEGTGSEYYYAYYTESGKRVREPEPPSVPSAMPPARGADRRAGHASGRGAAKANAAGAGAVDNVARAADGARGGRRGRSNGTGAGTGTGKAQGR